MLAKYFYYKQIVRKLFWRNFTWFTSITSLQFYYVIEIKSLTILLDFNYKFIILLSKFYQNQRFNLRFNYKFII